MPVIENLLKMQNYHWIFEFLNKSCNFYLSFFLGIAFPCCISVNNCICHYSPLNSEADTVMQVKYFEKSVRYLQCIHCIVLKHTTVGVPAWFRLKEIIIFSSKYDNIFENSWKYGKSNSLYLFLIKICLFLRGRCFIIHYLLIS